MVWVLGGVPWLKMEMVYANSNRGSWSQRMGIHRVSDRVDGGSRNSERPIPLKAHSD